jgi:hypothetical protein
MAVMCSSTNKESKQSLPASTLGQTPHYRRSLKVFFFVVLSKKLAFGAINPLVIVMDHSLQKPCGAFYTTKPKYLALHVLCGYFSAKSALIKPR